MIKPEMEQRPNSGTYSTNSLIEKALKNYRPSPFPEDPNLSFRISTSSNTHNTNTNNNKKRESANVNDIDNEELTITSDLVSNSQRSSFNDSNNRSSHKSKYISVGKVYNRSNQKKKVNESFSNMEDGEYYMDNHYYPAKGPNVAMLSARPQNPRISREIQTRTGLYLKQAHSRNSREMEAVGGNRQYHSGLAQ